MISLQTNVSAMIATKQSNQNGSALSVAIERLSSGMRINSARDDAAGQAIANRFSSQQSGLAQAQRNTGDGLSMVDTASSALDEVNNRLQRIRQLTVQGLNGTNSQEDTDSIQAEINLNLKEINRLNSSSSFNGLKLLDGSAGRVGIQVGANDNQKIGVDLSSGFSVSELGLDDFVISGISGKVTAVPSLTGLALNMSLSSPDITVAYSPAADSPQLVQSSSNGQQFIQTTGSDGKPTYYLASVSARWDTASAAGNVLISRSTSVPLYSPVESIASRSMTSINYQDNTGTALSNTPAPTLTEDSGQYYIQQDDNYYPATISYGSSGAITATMTTDPAKTDSDFTTLPTTVNATPTVTTSSATLSFSDSLNNAVANSDARLLRTTGGQYVMEVDNGGGSYQYYNATVTTTSDGNDVSLSVKATSATSINSFNDVTSVTGTSYITLDPANVDVRYTDAQGVSSNDVLRLDSDGNYYMGVPDGRESKTATFVTEDSAPNALMLKTLRGVGDVQIYYMANVSSVTDTSTNLTTTSVKEVGDEIRLKHPDDPLATLDRAIARVDSQRSELGATANRLSSAQSLQSGATTNLASARSRIEDADYAAEVSALTRAQIVQQASSSVLAKANLQPQQVLTLLQG
ncbi:flagellin [Pantoea sp. Taur]|uniref:flagellin N-terminal helical domain-containing protein n=1 Tax=Pantoea sp. Taur TaxID=2576757 RepID=UPI001353A6AB|nr:flagellin [Pantoea sp. Taur]MXP58453.1 flagellin [Pantoea sp. Taur]